MNKKEFINALSEELNVSYEDSVMINDILENNFVLSKKNKDKIIEELETTLEIEREEASKIYDTAISIINREMKHSLKHPFKSKD